MADPQVQANDEQEIAEAQNSLADLLYDVVAQAATTRLGAFVYRRIDSVLSTVEKTAKWSLPQPAPTAAPAPAPPAPAQEGGPAPAEGDPNPNPDANNAGTGKISAPPLIRPLPWMLFLPALVVMRMVRIGLSLLALMVGRPPVTPTLVVYFIQNKRRKLRALKYRGQKLNRISRAEAKAEDELQTTWLSRITMPLRRIVCRPGRVVVTPHRHHHHRHQSQRQQNQQQQNQQQQQQQGQQQDQQPGRKRNAHERDIDDDSEVDESTVNELLDKYVDVEEDSSYHADSGSSDSSDTSLSEQEKSTVEDGPAKKAVEPSSSTFKKESNGHGPKEGSQARRKSDLNVEADPKPAENGSVDGAKKQDAAKEPAIKESEKTESKDSKPKATENGPSDGSKSQDAAKEERQKSESNKPKPNPPASGSESADSKQTSAAGQKNQQEEDAAKNQSMSDVKANSQQKIKHQQQQNQQQNQPQNQPQHANANGGNAGKKQKRPSQGHQ